jgi:hypothetical protein
MGTNVNGSDEYTKRIREECFKAILKASIDDGEIRLNEGQIYEGVISAIAMIHASQDEAPTIEKTAMVSDAIARHFRERVAELKAVKTRTANYTAKTRH